MNFKDIDFKGLRKWQQEGNRHVKIEFGGSSDKTKLSIWAYDFSLQAGQHLKTGKVSEIDLISVKKEDLREAIRKLEELDS